MSNTLLKTDGGDEPLLLTLAQACARLGVSRSTLDRLIRDGKIAYVQPFTDKRITPEALRAYVASLAVQSNKVAK